MSLTKVLRVFEAHSSVRRKVATVLVLKMLNKAKIACPEVVTDFLIKRVCRARLDIRLFISLIWLECLLVGIPKDIEIWKLSFQIWDLRDEIWRLRFLILPIFKFLCYLQGFCEGTCFGLLVAVTLYGFIQWIELQRQKCHLYYLLYRCKG